MTTPLPTIIENYVIPETDDEKNNDTMNVDDDFQFVINDENYEKLFKKLKFKKSKKLIHYLMNKIMLFGNNYNNPKRKKIIRRLQTMKKPYRKVFDEDFV